MKRKLRAIIPLTFKGKVMVFFVKSAFVIISPFVGKEWKQPLTNFEENPLFYNSKDIIYLGYKYYFRPPMKYDSVTVSYFRNQKIDFQLNDNFTDFEEVTISVGGDLMPYEWSQKKYTEHLWDDVGDFFFNSDIVFANLETPININEPVSMVPEVMLSDMKFNANEEIFNVFNGGGKYKGFDILSTANNHSYDMGEKGVIETINYLKSKKIVPVGTSTTKDNEPVIIERKGIKIAFIAYTYSLNMLELPKDKSHLVNHLRVNKKDIELTEIKEDVQKARNNGADIVFLSLHTGNAYQQFPSNHTIENYHRLFDECGVDAVLGGHPHNPQPMEKYEFICPFTKKKKNGFAIYSLADFVAYDIFTWDHLIPLLKIHVKKGIKNHELQTEISKIETLPVYHWASPKKHGKREFRFLRLDSLMNDINQGNLPVFLKRKRKKEVLFLNEMWDNNFEIQFEK